MRHLILMSGLLCMLFASGQAAVARHELAVANDSIFYKAGEIDGAFTMSELSNQDTVRFWDLNRIIFSSGSASVTLTGSNELVPLRLTGGDNSIGIYIWFAHSEDRSSDMLAVLREYPEFGNTPSPVEFQFSYTPPSDSELTELRERYQLDSIAGNGSEIARALNLMRWVHETVTHDGGSLNPTPQDALHLLSVCTDSGRAVNCRMMAVILNEVSLAEGLTCRHLTCLPEDQEDSDCHVVDIVWSDTLSKWVLIDPTFLGYFTDSQGVMQSPLEVRQALIAGDSIVISEELDYNGSPYSRDQYRSYMTKNLFRFTTPLVSAPGYETLPEGELVQIALNPVGYHPELVAVADTSQGSSRKFIEYYTDNAEWFWEK